MGKGPKSNVLFVWKKLGVTNFLFPYLAVMLTGMVFEQDSTSNFCCAWTPLMKSFDLNSFPIQFPWVVLFNSYENTISFEWYLWFWEWNSEGSSWGSLTPHASAVTQGGFGYRNSLLQGNRMYFKTCCNSFVAVAEHPSLLSFFPLSALAMGVQLK